MPPDAGGPSAPDDPTNPNPDDPTNPGPDNPTDPGSTDPSSPAPSDPGPVVPPADPGSPTPPASPTPPSPPGGPPTFPSGPLPPSGPGSAYPPYHPDPGPGGSYPGDPYPPTTPAPPTAPTPTEPDPPAPDPTPPTPPKDPAIQIDINDTKTNNDDITLFSPVVQTIKARFTNTGGAGTVKIVVPNGFASVSPATLTLAAGGVAEITITPLKESDKVDDVIIKAIFNGADGEKEVGTNAMTNVSVTLPEKVRNVDTPDAMPDRIPPRVDTPLKIKLSPDLGDSGQVVTLVVPKSNGVFGTVNFGQAGGVATATIDLTASGTINIQGGTQTSVGRTPGIFAGKLQLTARVHGEDTSAATPGFSVAAIPVNWSENSLGKAGLITTGLTRGINVRCHWQSDSGKLADLSEVKIRESLSSVATGSFVGEPFEQSDYKSATPGRDIDHHYQGVFLIGGEESQIDYDQLNFFRDNRTGVRDIVIENAGYHITQNSTVVNGVWFLRTTKIGAKATVINPTTHEKFTSEAGSVVGGPIDSGKLRR